MKEQLKKMFGESFPNIEKCSIKTEDTFHAQRTSQNHYEEIWKWLQWWWRMETTRTLLTSCPLWYLNRPSQSHQQEQFRYPTNNS